MSRGSEPAVRQYWDACLFIDLVNKTAGRVDVLEALWDDLIGNDPKVIAVTSMLTVAEVAYAAEEKKLHQLNPKAIAKIDGFWAPGSPVELVELYNGVAYEARQLMRQAIIAGNSLRPHDAIHFATARKRGCKLFLTYDERLYKFNGTFGFPVKAPVSSALPYPAAAGARAAPQPLQTPRAKS